MSIDKARHAYMVSFTLHHTNILSKASPVTSSNEEFLVALLPSGYLSRFTIAKSGGVGGAQMPLAKETNFLLFF